MIQRWDWKSSRLLEDGLVSVKTAKKPLVHEKHVMSTAKHPGSVLVWRCFSGKEMASLTNQPKNSLLRMVPKYLPRAALNHQTAALWRMNMLQRQNCGSKLAWIEPVQTLIPDYILINSSSASARMWSRTWLTACSAFQKDWRVKTANIDSAKRQCNC